MVRELIPQPFEKCTMVTDASDYPSVFTGDVSPSRSLGGLEE